MMSDEATANIERGPGAGICGHYGTGTLHCMRDFDHPGDHELIDLATGEPETLLQWEARQQADMDSRA